MAELKTKPTQKSVVEFLNQVSDVVKRKDSFTILELMKEVAQEPPVMWGEAIVGFGSYHYRYASGREGDMPLIGFSPRVQNLTLYITTGFDQFGELLQKLGKHSTGKGCLYIKRLDDIDLPTLRELVRQSVEHMKRTNP
jgi:hypothetical protein